MKLPASSRAWVWVGTALAVIVASGLVAGWMLQHYDENIAFQREADEIARVLDLRPGMTVGDVRAGTGRWTVDMARRVGPGGHAYATAGPNPPHELLSTVAAAGLDNVTVITRTPGETGRLPLDCCEAVLVRGVFHELQRDRPEVIRNLIHNVRPGGLVAVIDFDEGTPEHEAGHGIARGTAKAVFVGAGFELVEEIEDWAGHAYCLVFRRPHGLP